VAKKRLLMIQLITGIVLLTATISPALADDFYKGKKKHIPGHSTFIVLNMPGASSRVAATYVYNIAKPDGLTLGIISNNSFLDQVVGRHEVKFDLARKRLPRPSRIPKFLDEAEKLRLELNPYVGEELQAHIEKLLVQTPDLIQRLKQRLK